MFNQMRSVLALQRASAIAERKSPLRAQEILACATIEGARAVGLDTKVGTLTPGKQADLIMLRTDRINVTPLNDPATAVVAGMDTGNVDTVVIAGRVMKRHGELLHVDWPAVRRMATESRDFVLAKSGFKPPSI
jgi:5-methylthioadenosine/S-adenosylhomocysteine deaminase